MPTPHERVYGQDYGKFEPWYVATEDDKLRLLSRPKGTVLLTLSTYLSNKARGTSSIEVLVIRDLNVLWLFRECNCQQLLPLVSRAYKKRDRPLFTD
jgi:hypothetical protein